MDVPSLVLLLLTFIFAMSACACCQCLESAATEWTRQEAAAGEAEASSRGMTAERRVWERNA